MRNLFSCALSLFALFVIGCGAAPELALTNLSDVCDNDLGYRKATITVDEAEYDVRYLKRGIETDYKKVFAKQSHEAKYYYRDSENFVWEDTGAITFFAKKGARYLMDISEAVITGHVADLGHPMEQINVNNAHPYEP